MSTNLILYCAVIAFTASCISAQERFSDLNTQKSFPELRYILGKFDNENPEDYYLPKTMIPKSYVIELEPRFEFDDFNGHVTIVGLNEENINQIVLHTLNLNILNVTVQVNNNTPISPEYHFDTEKEFLILDMVTTIEENSVIELNIYYTGTLDTTKKNRGFYIATYLDEFGVEHRLATTHMEPTNAREVFPCFDEPALKAMFTIIVVRPKHFNSKSNMPLDYVSTWAYDGTKEADVFLETPPMSTYLVVVVVSEFATISSSFPDQATHELHGDTADLRKNYGDLALMSSRQVISVMEEYTGIKFNLPKIGQVAIPEGFFGGAMENWGLVIYGETSLLFKPNVSTEIQRNGVVNIIAHEYAHQWFGDLVGPESWAYTWLNEGFAAYFTMRLPTMVYPSWRYDEQFAWKIPNTMFPDANINTRPMTMPVGSPENIRNTFDVVAYDKSACVIRMFEHALSRDTFRKALNIYLTNRRFAGATADDLIDSFVEALQPKNPLLAENIKVFFDSWHLQKGFPLLTVIRNYTDNTVTFKQKRFIDSGEESNEVYHIPLNIFTKSSSPEEKADTNPQFWFGQQELLIDLLPETRDSYLILNKHFTGYYRVNYDRENWMRIIQNEQSFRDMPKNRVQLLEDAYALWDAGLLDVELPLRLFSEIQLNDDNYLVTKSSIKYFDWLYKFYHDNQIIMDYLIKTFRKAFDRYSDVEHDGSYIDTLMRNELIARMCRINDPICLDAMHHHMQQDYVLQSPNLQTSVVCAGLMNTKDAEAKFKLVLEQIAIAQDNEVKNRLGQALLCTKDHYMGIQILNWIAYPDTNFLQIHPFTLMRGYCQDIQNAARALDYYLEMFATLTESYNIDDMKTLLMAIAVKLNREENVKTIEEFLANSTVEDFYLVLFEQAITTIQHNIGIVNPDIFNITNIINN